MKEMINKLLSEINIFNESECGNFQILMNGNAQIESLVLKDSKLNEREIESLRVVINDTILKTSKKINEVLIANQDLIK